MPWTMQSPFSCRTDRRTTWPQFCGVMENVTVLQDKNIQLSVCFPEIIVWSSQVLIEVFFFHLLSWFFFVLKWVFKMCQKCEQTQWCWLTYTLFIMMDICVTLVQSLWLFCENSVSTSGYDTKRDFINPCLQLIPYYVPITLKLILINCLIAHSSSFCHMLQKCVDTALYLSVSS